MKKLYQSPEILVVNVHYQKLLATTGVENTSGNSGIGYGRGGSGPAHSRRLGDWDDEDY